MILVTGGTGLVGAHLLFELAKNNETVKAIVRNRDKIKLVENVFSYYTDKPKDLINKIVWIDGDVLDLESLENAFVGVDKVYHCAAMVAIGGKQTEDIIDVNVTGTANVVNLCLNNSIEKICHVSSIAALGGSLNGELINENSKWTSSKNHSAYSISKFKSEMEIWRGIQEGLNAVIVNPSVIIGPGFWNSGSGSLFSKAAKGMKYFTNGTTGFVDVLDVVGSMINLMNSEVSSERYVLNSENISYKILFDLIAESMNVAKPKREATLNILKVVSFLDSIASSLGLKKQEITKDVVRSSVSESRYSSEKIKNELGMEFIPIESSINRIAGLFKKDLMNN